MSRKTLKAIATLAAVLATAAVVPNEHVRARARHLCGGVVLGSRGAASRGCWASGGSDRSSRRRPRRDVRRLRRSHRARIGRRRRQRCPRWPFRGRIDDPARPICCSRLTSQRARFPGKIDRAAGCAGRRMDSDEWHDYRPTLRRMRTSRVATVSAAPAKPVRSCSSFARAGGAPVLLVAVREQRSRARGTDPLASPCRERPIQVWLCHAAQAPAFD